MKTPSIVFLLLASCPLLFGQEAAPKLTFTHTLQSNLSFAQSTVYDWQQGEKSLLDVKNGFTARFGANSPLFRAGISLKAQLGVQKESPEDTPPLLRATDNELFGEGVFSAVFGWQVDPYISVSLRTPITESHRVQKNALVRTAKLWDPVTSEESLGFTYGMSGKYGTFSMRGGGNLQQIRADNHRELTDNPKTRNEKEGYKASAGVEFVVEGRFRADTTITYNTRLNMRKNVIDESSWQGQWENETRVKVWKFIGVILTVNMAYNETQSKRVQIKQSLQLGVLADL